MSKAIYADRFERFVQRLRDAGLTAATVYADREHLANLSYLTGFDPRFEEALMVVVPGRDPVILTGPENQGTARAASINVEVKLYPPFGLLGQDRSRTPPLADLLRDAGIAAGAKVGAVGWKYFGRQETSAPEAWIEIPSFVVDTIQVDRRPLRLRLQRHRNPDGRERRASSDQRDRPARAIRVCRLARIGVDQARALWCSRRHARIRGGEPDASDRAFRSVATRCFRQDRGPVSASRVRPTASSSAAIRSPQRLASGAR